MSQQSMFPAEVPDESGKKKLRQWRMATRFERFLEQEGYYNYCMMALEIKSKSEPYILEKYQMSKDELWRIINSVFQRACNHSESIEGFLANLKNIPGYSLAYITREHEKAISKKNARKRR